MELVFMIDACTRSNCRSVTVVTPLYPYARQDKKDRPRVPISAKVVADILQDVGTTRLITMDLHAAQIQGFFRIPVDNIYAINHICAYLETFTKPDSHILVSPDNGGSKRIDAYSKRLGLRSVIMHKSRDHSKPSVVTKSILVGATDDIEGKIAVIVDDMLDTGGTIIRACETLSSFGLASVVVVVTHGIFSGPAVEHLQGCEAITQVVVTNTLPMEGFKESFPKLHVVDVSGFFGDVLSCIFTGDSVSKFFE
jgi:ribose-phosphate pyrophosphokinase